MFTSKTTTLKKNEKEKKIMGDTPLVYTVTGSEGPISQCCLMVSKSKLFCLLGFSEKKT